MKTQRIIVVGSCNQDYLVRVPRTPRGGETTIATSLVKQPGGKGANQAVAAARLGAAVSLVGAVGRDDDGARILRSLQKDGVSVDDVRIVDREPTGLALISVDDTGENSITVVSGANGTVTPDRAAAVVQRLGGPEVIVVLQGELPVGVLEESARAASAVGARVILNLAPFGDVAADVLALADPLVVNETEAGQLLGSPITGIGSAISAVETLRSVSKSAVVTLGGLGAVWSDFGGASTEPQHAAAVATSHVVDTTGAGDAFVGALAFALSSDGDLGRAVVLGTRAGTFAIRAVGAQSSYARASDLGDSQAVS